MVSVAGNADLGAGKRLKSALDNRDDECVEWEWHQHIMKKMYDTEK